MKLTKGAKVLCALLAAVILPFSCAYAQGEDAATAAQPVGEVMPQETGAQAPETSDDALQTPVITQEPQAPLGTRENPVRAGEAFEIVTELLSDGTARTTSSDEAYETVRFSITLTNAYQPAYYARKYARLYKLTGAEAGAGMQVAYLSAEDETPNADAASAADASSVPEMQSAAQTKTIKLQTALGFSFETEDGAVNDGYVLMDSEIGGSIDVYAESGKSVYVCKRYQYDAQAPQKYMVVTSYVGGTAQKTYFLLETVYETLERGSRGDTVQEMQEALVELGYLNDSADGIFGANTEKAVIAAQAAAGLPQTGIADSAFQNNLYSGALKPVVQDEASQ